jgi:hypothetical protein
MATVVDDPDEVSRQIISHPSAAPTNFIASETQKTEHRPAVPRSRDKG